MSVMKYSKAAYRKLKFRQVLKSCTVLSAETAERVLLDYFPRRVPNFHQDNEIDPVYDVMIIVPVYNVEKYLEQCIQSILNQKTNYTYQAVFVDDGSADSSGAILDQCIPAPHVVIHKKNGGLSAARNDAMLRITGRYLMFVDSDDYLATDILEKLVSVADVQNADIVECGHSEFNEAGIFARISHAEEIKEISHRELYGFAWGKLIRSELVRDFCFPVGYWFEDTVMAAHLHPMSRKSMSIPDIGYYYRDNQAGITHTSKHSKGSVDTFWMMKYCLEERLRRGQVMEQADYQRYLAAVRRNWIRIQGLPEEIQTAVFALTCDLFDRCLPFRYEGDEHRMNLLEQAIQNRSYEAYCFLMERWDIL